jgi:signal transduction histidine kinase
MLFHNLIKNAYERLQQGGSLRVTLKGSEDGRLAVMIFEDTGPGFAREALDKLFAPFNTTDKGKAGIGLAVARRIAEKHGGTLEVSNKKERGAIVEVRLPLGTTAP